MLKFAPSSSGRNDGELSALLATGMIVFAMEDVHAGDGVELDEQAQ